MATSSQPSVFIDIGPSKKRSRYWAKRIYAGTALSLPDSISCAEDIPGPFLSVGGEVELAVGDFVIEGEEVHFRHKRGWSSRIGYMGIDGALHRVRPDKGHKQAMKAAGMALDQLKGSGSLAACVRLIAALRMGLRAGVVPIETQAAPVTMRLFAEISALQDVWFESSSREPHPSAQQIYDQVLMRSQMLTAQDGMEDLPNLAALLGD
jgi:hypothetical protein